MQQNGNSGLRCLNMSGTPVAASYRRWSTRKAVSALWSWRPLKASSCKKLSLVHFTPPHPEVCGDNGSNCARGPRTAGWNNRNFACLRAISGFDNSFQALLDCIRFFWKKVRLY